VNLKENHFFLVKIVMEQWYFTIFDYVTVTNKQYKIFWCRIHYYIFQQNYKLKHLIYFQSINLLIFIFSFNIEWKFAKYAFVKISNNNNWWFQHINMLSTTFESVSLQDFMKNYYLNITLTKMTSIYNRQIKHEWTNVPRHNMLFWIIHAYWPYHNLYILHLNYQIMFPILYCLDFSWFFVSHICFNIQGPQNNLFKHT
jgi:hypothetical protein